MSPDEAYELISPFIQNAGSFYGHDPSLAIGAGQIYTSILYPIYDETRALFATVRGSVYVLTHECDISPDNDRPFNDDVAIIPLIPFQRFVEVFLPTVVETKQRSFLMNLVKGHVSRMCYFPPVAGFDLGAVIFLNQIASTKAHMFENTSSKRLATLSVFGRRKIDYVFENNFLRETQKPPLWQSFKG